MTTSVKHCTETHRIQQQSTVTAGGTGGTRTGVAGSTGPSAPGNPIAGMAILKSNLLLLPEDLDLGGSEAKRSVGNRG
ncbi:hypothetical protein EYZ11_007282 [Aspergillus tanneri]|uniref:Uncharacterized protein n=1 Tax=Aspergillus tanneri TaxID=1220188 RepID=A0A4S3JFM8_9EURO|nr:hypothetical protein EYZ11_007282 [Aspergillus tanneri]